MTEKCTRCGECCKKLSGTFDLSKEEVEKWSNEFVSSNFGIYPAINFAYVWFDSEGNVVAADLFFHPITGEELYRCPFLRKLPSQSKYTCLIHASLKPLVCRDYKCEKMKKG